MTDNDGQPIKPVAFVIMPFGTKRPDVVEGEVIPDEIDFDQLWDDVFHPVLAETHTPIRADQDFGPLIIVDMIERLTAADLVIADITLRNANVYWEVGVRQAAKPIGCVLVAAEWARPAFDLDQVRQVRYPLPQSPLPGPGIEQAKRVIKDGLAKMANSSSPVFEAVPDFPSPNPLNLSSFQEYAAEMENFRTRVALIRGAGADKASATAELVAQNPPGEPRSKAVVWEMLGLIRDHLGWEDLIEYIRGLPESLRDDPDVIEQQFLAVSKAGRSQEAAIQLERMIERLGQTGERCGLLGGRYKQLWKEAPEGSTDARRFLRKSIEAYENGMYTDLNQYYCASNLPRLYRSLDPEDDELREKAARATAITLAACDRARQLDREDEWLKPTLLGAAFEEGQLEKARQLVEEIEDEGNHVEWKLTSTMDDLRTSAARYSGELGEELSNEVAKLEALVNP